MTFAPSHFPHYTLADYEQWEGNWELWDGYAVAMTPSPSFDHQEALTNLAAALRSSLAELEGCHCKTVVEVDWRVAEDTVVRPDVMIVCEPVKTKWVEVTPSLVVEVLSPSTRKNDLNYKRSLYAKQGVTYYLIVDPKAQTIEALYLVDDQYRETGLDGISLHDGCVISLDTNAIWS